MGHHKRGTPRTQTELLPPTIEDYVGGDSISRVIDAYVSGVDMAGVGFGRSAPAHTGRPSYAPDDLLKLYLYGYWNRLCSSRKLESECRRNLEVMWLLGRLSPDHKTIAEFRRVNAKALREACAAFVRCLREMKVISAEAPVVAIDGSKFQASAAKGSVLNAEQLSKRQSKIERQINDYLEELDRGDQREEQVAQLTPAQIEAAVERLRKQQHKLQEAQMELQAREQLKRKNETPRVALTDPDCVMLNRHGEALVGYNVQQAVESEHKFIVAHEVTTCRNDHGSLESMACQAQDALAAEAMTAVTDRGYVNGQQAQACEERGITPVVPGRKAANTHGNDLYSNSQFVYDSASDTYRCPAGAILRRTLSLRSQQADRYETDACEQCPLKAQCTKGTRRRIERSWFKGAAERADQRARDNPRLMRLRGATAEHPFGNLKAMLGGRFSLRTLAKVAGEMALAVLTYNLKRAVSVLGAAQLTQILISRAVASPA